MKRNGFVRLNTAIPARFEKLLVRFIEELSKTELPESEVSRLLSRAEFKACERSGLLVLFIADELVSGKPFIQNERKTPQKNPLYGRIFRKSILHAFRKSLKKIIVNEAVKNNLATEADFLSCKFWNAGLKIRSEIFDCELGEIFQVWQKME